MVRHSLYRGCNSISFDTLSTGPRDTVPNREYVLCALADQSALDAPIASCTLTMKAIREYAWKGRLMVAPQPAYA
jgi:hypothetical protein